MESFQRARLGRQDQPFKPLAVRTLAEQQAELPGWRLDHLVADDRLDGHVPARHLHHPQLRRGVLHRRQRPGPAPDRAPGAAGPGARPQVQRLATTYAAFLQAAFDRDRRRFRNFMSFDRRWLEEVGSEDCQGRALWALGACVGRSQRRDLPVLGRRSSSSWPCRRSSR